MVLDREHTREVHEVGGKLWCGGPSTKINLDMCHLGRHCLFLGFPKKSNLQRI